MTGEQVCVNRTALAALLRRVDPQGFLSGDLGVAWGADGHLVVEPSNHDGEVPCPTCGGSMRFCECMDDPFAPEPSDDRLWESIARLEDSVGVGTGAGEGATGQDNGTAWVTRSVDYPEAPAQAHPLGPGVKCDFCEQPGHEALICLDHAAEAVTPRYTDALEVSLEVSRQVGQAERRAEDAEAAIEATRDLLDGWEQDGPDDYAVRLLIQRVREMLALGERFRAGREGERESEPLPIHRTEAGYPSCSTCDGGGCYDCTDPA